ncbi:hypothetical protein QBC45DRAFT_309871, partial [Copromyces sp. CBS 386.78]
SEAHLPVETSVYAAVQDIQARFCPAVMAADSYEMVWVIEYLIDQPLRTVIYHASGAATRRELVNKWKDEV